jgi:hypothetical protein
MGHDQVIDDTNPANVDRTGNSRRLADGQLVPDYGQFRSRMPAIVVSNTARLRVAHKGPLEHGSALKMSESTFGLIHRLGRQRRTCVSPAS